MPAIRPHISVILATRDRPRFLPLALAVLAGVALVGSAPSEAGWYETHHNRNARWRAAYYPWNSPFYHPSWGQPVALVIPPTAELTSDYAWGVGSVQVVRNDHQFQRPYPGPGVGGDGFAPAPVWPSHTRELGVYPVRGPW